MEIINESFVTKDEYYSQWLWRWEWWESWDMIFIPFYRRIDHKFSITVLRKLTEETTVVQKNQNKNYTKRLKNNKNYNFQEVEDYQNDHSFKYYNMKMLHDNWWYITAWDHILEIKLQQTIRNTSNYQIM